MTDDATTYDASIYSDEQAGQPAVYVAVVAGAGPAVVELQEGAEVSIGRSRSCAISVDDGAVSRLQATLRWDGNRVYLSDHGSRNGTYVDGDRIEGTVEVSTGSEVSVGKGRLVVVVRALGDAAGDRSAIEEEGVVARDPAMLAVLALAERAACKDVTVLISGETGCGKEVVAKRIHDTSGRATKDFVAVNCGSIPESIAESTLFGHERGAFTGANALQHGYFEAAHGGTLFLDEVGELSATMQARLLRALQERTITRVGSTEPITIDVRIVAATNRDLTAMVRDGSFREDLLYRLDVLRLEVPPLRDRPDDVVPLAERFISELAPGARLSPDARHKLKSHPWPGNVRELHNAIERAAALHDGDVIRADDLSLDERASPGMTGGVLSRQVGEVERDAIAEALEACDGNQTKAAQRLGISRRSFIYKMDKYGLKKRRGR